MALLLLIAFWLSWTIRGCSHDAQVHQLVESMQSQQAESTRLLQATSTQLATMTTNIVNYQRTVTEQAAAAWAELDERLVEAEKKRQQDLEELTAAVREKLAEEHTQLRRYYDHLLENPEAVGADFDNWTTPPEYWEGPTSGDSSP